MTTVDDFFEGRTADEGVLATVDFVEGATANECTLATLDNIIEK